MFGRKNGNGMVYFTWNHYFITETFSNHYLLPVIITGTFSNHYGTATSQTSRATFGEETCHVDNNQELVA